MAEKKLNELPCLVQGCFSTASYHASDDRARYGHVCRFCHEVMSAEEQALYAKVTPRAEPSTPVPATERSGYTAEEFLKLDLDELKRKLAPKPEDVPVPSGVSLSRFGRRRISPPSGPVLPQAAHSYLVERGDSPWRIAEKFTGDGFRWPELVETNPQKARNPDRGFASLIVGEMLLVPASWSAHVVPLDENSTRGGKDVLLYWRGSVSDLVTDLRAELSAEQLRELANALTLLTLRKDGTK